MNDFGSIKMQQFSCCILTVLLGLHVALGSSDETVLARSKATVAVNASLPFRWWRTDSDVRSFIHGGWRNWHRQSVPHRVKSEDENRKLWLKWNGAYPEDQEDTPSVKDDVIKASDREEIAESLSLLENVVHPEEELLDEINDRQIIQAVISSMAQWNLRKLQKMQRKSEQTRHRSRRNEAMVCYNELGCFRDEGPFNYLDLLPSPPEEINTRFFLYTARNRDSPHMLLYNNASTVVTSPYNASLPTKVMIHGFGSSCQRIWAKEMRTALISVGDVNVICVDWENGANLPNYVRAAVNARLVGRQVSLLINALNGLLGSKNGDFHLIGFSLGAHVAGFAGSELRNVSRITGLDPAGPLFENYDPRARLDSTDADLVDVIHSNGEKIYMGGLGAWAPMGDIDFYPNGGRMQKGCTNLFVGAVSDMIWSSAEENGRSLCNHRRAYKLFTDSVVPGCHFPAFACESYEKLLEGDCFPCTDGERCSNMGYYADKSPGRGIMYLATREEEPFCANQYRVQLQSTTTLQPVTTQGKIEIVLIGNNNFNETFTLTKGPDYELTSGGKLVRLIVPHPTFSPPTKVHVVYTAYHGWIYSGLPKWPIDKLVMTDSYGKSVSYCQKGMYLESGKGIAITLHPGDCNPASTLPLSPTVTNSLINPGPFPARQPIDSAPIDNEIPVMNEIRFRSMDSEPINQTTSELKSITPLTRTNNVTNNIYPYGNVPLSLLQQQIPADIKVGGGAANNGNPSTSKRPSFYQWPLVGNFFSSNGRARFKSLGGGTGGRKYEPQGQLTPPSFQQLQQGNGAGNKEQTTGVTRRPFPRRNNPQQSMSVEDQTKVEYFLLRQQQLHLQQQQFHQANRLWGDFSRSQLPRSRQEQQALSFQQYQQLLYQQQQNSASIQWVPQRQVVPPPPPPPQWRPDALVDPEVTRYPLNGKPGIQGESFTTLEHVQQAFGQTLPGSQQFAERTRNQQPAVQIVPQIRSSIIPPGNELTNTPTLTSSLVVSNALTTSTTAVSSSPVTLTTMTISNTLPSASQQLTRSPEVEQMSNDSPSSDMQSSESIQTSYTKPATEDSVLYLATVEAATLLAAKTPSSNRQMNDTAVTTNNITTNSSAPVSQNSTSVATNESNVIASNVSSVASTKEDGLLRDGTNAAMLWSDYPFTSDSGSNPILVSDELYPNPEQLGQVRDEYWSNKASLASKGRQISPSSSLTVVGSTYFPHQYAAARPSRLQLQEHQPLYIPLNPADRHNRQLQAQYYAETSSPQKTTSEPLVSAS